MIIYMVQKAEFDKFKVKITDTIGYKIDKITGEQYPYANAEFHSVDYCIITKHQCRQNDPLIDITKDVMAINNGNISGTVFYKHWMKLFFIKRSTCYLTKGDVVIYSAEYLKQDTFKENTFYLNIGSIGDNEKIKGWYWVVNGKKILL
jgi:hypothetical protein